jgi:hypothetical protein
MIGVKIFSFFRVTPKAKAIGFLKLKVDTLHLLKFRHYPNEINQIYIRLKGEKYDYIKKY